MNCVKAPDVPVYVQLLQVEPIEMVVGATASGDIEGPNQTVTNPLTDDL